MQILNQTGKLLLPKPQEEEDFPLDTLTNVDEPLHKPLTADHTLSPEWDLLSNIDPLMPYHNEWLFTDIVWIKAHQDDRKPYSTLDLEAQLNCDADQLAADVHNHKPRKLYNVVPLSRACPVHFDLSNSTVTSKLPNKIRRSWNNSKLKEHIAKTNNWTPQTTKTVDWNLHKRSLSKQIGKKIHYCKLVHDILPTNSFLSKYEPTKLSNCARCQYEHEDRDHIIKCPSSDIWFKNLILQLQMKMKMLQTEPALQSLFLQGLKAWRNINTLPVSHLPRELREVLQEQDNIGWRQIFNGRISSKWARIQEQFETTHNLPNQRWGSKIMEVIWQQWDVLWKERNDIQHGTDPASRRLIRTQQALTELRHIYNRKHLYVPSDRNLLFETYEEHAAKPLYVVESWLAFYCGVFKSSMKEAERESTTHTKSLHTYFQPTHRKTKKHKLPQQLHRNQKRRKTSTHLFINTPRLERFFHKKTTINTKTTEKTTIPDNT